MGLKLNAANGGGSVELDVPSTVNSDLALTVPATAGEIVVKDSSGKVGIGTSSPQRDLHIHNASSSTNAYLQLTSATTGTGSTDGFQLWAYGNGGNTNAAIVQRENAALEIWTDNTERMRIDADGKLQLGDDQGTAQAELFQVIRNGGGQGTNDCMVYFETTQNDWCLRLDHAEALPGNAYFINCTQQGNQRGKSHFSSSSGVMYWATNSDYRLKKNVTPVTNGISEVKRLNPVNYNWIEFPAMPQVGFLAHELDEVCPYAVDGEKDAVNEDGSIDPQMVDKSHVVPLLTAALKEAIAKIETLETKVAALEAK